MSNIKVGSEEVVYSRDENFLHSYRFLWHHFLPASLPCSLSLFVLFLLLSRSLALSLSRSLSLSLSLCLSFSLCCAASVIEQDCESEEDKSLGVLVGWTGRVGLRRKPERECASWAWREGEAGAS